MTKRETIQRLCALVEEVADRAFDPSLVTHDCFCGENPLHMKNLNIDEKIILFIETAVWEHLRLFGPFKE